MILESCWAFERNLVMRGHVQGVSVTSCECGLSTWEPREGGRQAQGSSCTLASLPTPPAWSQGSLFTYSFLTCTLSLSTLNADFFLTYIFQKHNISKYFENMYHLTTYTKTMLY